MRDAFPSPISDSPMLDLQAAAQQRIGLLASRPPVHAAFQWLHLNEKRFREWQLAIIRIPAPPFGEEERAAWVLEEFRRIGLANAHMDAEGNVLGELLPEGAASGRAIAELRSGAAIAARGLADAVSAEPDAPAPLVLLSAHIDTVFPAGTVCEPSEDGPRIVAPGACDNAAGVAALLALASVFMAGGMRPRCGLLFAANVGEEGEGNLRGMRHLFGPSPYACRIAAAVALDGAGTESVVAKALGSRRYRATFRGPGGHSWADAGNPNPVLAMCRAMAELAEAELPSSPRTTLNIGTIAGGSAVNSIPESASAQVDIRSTDAEHLLRLEALLRRAVQDAAQAANAAAARASRRGEDSASAPLTCSIELIGERPAAELAQSAKILQSIRAVDRHLGLRTDMRVGSTDANVPLSLGREAISIGSGGTGGGVHTSNEWHDPTGRELALRRILLLLLDVCGTV